MHTLLDCKLTSLCHLLEYYLLNPNWKWNFKINNFFNKKIIMGTRRKYPSFQNSRKIDMEMLNEWFVAIPNHLSKFQITICRTWWTSVGTVYRPVVPGINSGIMDTTRMVWPELISCILFQFKYIRSVVYTSTPTLNLSICISKSKKNPFTVKIK